MSSEALWSVTVQGSSGTKTVKVKASDKATARSRASMYGSVVEVRKDSGGGLWRAGMKVPERATFMNKLAQLSLSKVPLSEGLRSMRDSMPGRAGAAAGMLLDAMNSGMNLSKAMEANPKDFPTAVVAIVKAGLKTGSTSEALKGAVEFERTFASAKKGSDIGITISAAQIVFAALIGASAGPMMDMMMGDIMQSMITGPVNPTYDTALMLSGLGSSVVAFFAAVLISAMVFFLFIGGVGKRLFPIFADSVILKIPYYRDLVLSLQNYISLYQLSLLLRAGVQLEKSLSLTSEATPVGAMKADLLKASVAVKQGRPWTDRIRMLSPTDRLSVAFASDRTTMADALREVAGFYKDEYANKLATISPMLKYVAFFMFTAVAAIVAIETMVPTFMLMEGLKI